MNAIYLGLQTTPQLYTIKLGSVDTLDSFSASFAPGDRPISTLSVATSTDGVNFTPVVGALSPAPTSNTGTFTYTFTGNAVAQYVQYDFGPASAQYGSGGSGVISVTADAPAVSAAPEPGAWALMLGGVGAMGLMLRRRRSGASLPA